MGGAHAGAAGRPEVLRPARVVAAHDAAADRVRRVGLRRRTRLRRLVDPRLAGDLRVGHAAHAAGRDRDPRPVHGRADAVARLRDPRPGDPRAVRPRPAPRRPPRRGAPARERHRRHRLLRPRVRVLRLRRGLVRARPEPLALRGRLGRGPLELRQAGPRLHRAREGGLLPAGPARHAARPALGDGADARAARDPVRVPPPRGGLGRPVRDRPALPAADPDGRSDHGLQVRRPERRPRRRQDRDVHAEADLRRQRLGHALPPVAVEGGHAADGRQVRPGRALAARTRLRRRADRARAGAAGALCADDELVPPARAGLRGAGQPRLLLPQPLGVHPHPDVLRLAEGEADRVPLSRPRREPVPRLLGDAARGPRRDRARARPGRSVRLRPVRGRPRRRRRCRARSRRRSTRSSAITSSCTKDGVFDESLIETWIAYKREHEVDPVRLRPHPAEFSLYFDC